MFANLEQMDAVLDIWFDDAEVALHHRFKDLLVLWFKTQRDSLGNAPVWPLTAREWQMKGQRFWHQLGIGEWETVQRKVGRKRCLKASAHNLFIFSSC